MADHSGMKLGKGARRFDARVPALAKYTRSLALPPPPDASDWSSAVETWPMDANDRIGDCTVAAAAHMIQAWTAYAKPEPIVLTEDQVIEAYSTITGYAAGDSSTDNGAVEMDVLQHWLNTGIGGDKIGAITTLNVAHLDEVKDAIFWFGGIYVGLALPLTAQHQDVWELVSLSGDGTPASWGGHAVPILGYDRDGLTCVTWGALKRMTWNFFGQYCDEAYALYTADFFTAEHKTPMGFNVAQIAADMILLREG